MCNIHFSQVGYYAVTKLNRLKQIKLNRLKQIKLNRLNKFGSVTTRWQHQKNREVSELGKTVLIVW